MSIAVVEHEARMGQGGVEAPLTLLDGKWAQNFSEAMAYGYGYQIDVALSDELPTSMTSLSLTDRKIQVRISRQLVERAEADDQLDFLGFNILHELGHVKRFTAQPPDAPLKPKYAYFQNIVDDIAINYSAARKTRFFADLTAKAYDRYLFPTEQRDAMSIEPRHKQFMEALLVLGMTTTAYQKPQSPEALANTLAAIGCGRLDDTVVEKLSKVVNFTTGKTRHNLLRQIREYGEDLPYYDRIVSHIRTMYDELYEEDLQDKQSQSGRSELTDGNQEPGENEFDYSNSGGCQHTESARDHSKPTEQNNDEHGNEEAPTSTDADGSEGDIAHIGKNIGEQIAEAISDNDKESSGEQKPQQMSAEQLAQLRKELGLEDADFQGFLETVNKYHGEIAAITDLILQLRRERQDNFLAPSHEVSARGHRIHVGKLLGYLASGSMDTTPDIWKTPTFLERMEYEFDGADFYFLCDASGSMANNGKAKAASESAVVLSQGIQDASFESYEDTPPIRIQVQAFGSGDKTLCELTDAPKNVDLGRMYKALRKPTSSSTQVSGALSKIKSEQGRLSIVLVLSDGEFHDEEQAMIESKRLENEGAVIVQCVFGGADVSKLSDNAKRVGLKEANDLPSYLFGIMPELIDALRRSQHA